MDLPTSLVFKLSVSEIKFRTRVLNGQYTEVHPSTRLGIREMFYPLFLVNESKV